MARRVVSVLRGGRGLPHASDAALEANAYAVAEDVHLTLVLLGRGVELGARSDPPTDELTGMPWPAAGAGRDLRGLVESGVGVYAAADALAEFGLEPTDLITGVQVVDDATVADLLRDADAVLGW